MVPFDLDADRGLLCTISARHNDFTQSDLPSLLGRSLFGAARVAAGRFECESESRRNPRWHLRNAETCLVLESSPPRCAK